MRFLYAVILCLLAASAFADSNDGWEWVKEGGQIQQDQSFGQHSEIWSQDHHHITGWKLSGESGHSPDVLSDRVILTPPHPGNRRAAMWADQPEISDNWHAEFEFRATGQERGSGNLQLWYAKDGHDQVGLASIYTVGKFDGMAIVISQYGGHGGSIRGFLNDGTTSMKDHHNVDRLAFGHCDFSYRNLGRFTHVSMKHTADSFEVEVDHRPCFKTHRVKLPSGNYFGITAASAENPDSFETKGFIVSSQAPQRENEAVRQDSHYESSHSNQEETTPNDGSWYWITEEQHVPNQPASNYRTDEARFEDLHNRISILATALDILYKDLSTLREEQYHHFDDVLHEVAPTHDNVQASQRMLSEIERMVKEIKTDVESKDYREHLNRLHEVVREGHATIASSIMDGSGRHWFFYFLVVVTQLILFASYVVYRRKLDAQPKKYL